MYAAMSPSGGDITRSEEHTSELQSYSDLPPFPTRRSSDLVDLSHASGEAIENAGLALSAMGDEGADVGFGLGDRRAVGRPVDHITAAEQFVERGHVRRHVAVGRRYHEIGRAHV